MPRLGVSTSTKSLLEAKKEVDRYSSCGIRLNLNRSPNEPPILLPRSHSEAHVCEVICRHFQALPEQVRSDVRHMISRVLSNPKIGNATCIEQCFMVFIKFLLPEGLLSGCKFKFIKDPLAKPLSDLGFCESDKHTVGFPDTSVIIYYRLNQTREQMLATLKHEVVHAIFFIYTCDCGARCMQAGQQRNGFTHHGYFWQKLCLAVDKAFEACGLEHIPSINRESSMALEIGECVKFKGVQVTSAAVKSWDESVEKVTGISKIETIELEWDLARIALNCVRYQDRSWLGISRKWSAVVGWIWSYHPACFSSDEKEEGETETELEKLDLRGLELGKGLELEIMKMEFV